MRTARSFVALVLALFLFACSDPASRLIGEWVQVEGSRPETRIIFREDGTGKLEVKDGVNYQLESWGVESERHLMFQIYSQDVLARFVLNKDSLEISRAEGFEQMNGTYRRVDSG